MPQKIPFCRTGFLFCHLDAKIHLENQIKQGAMSHCGLAIYIKKHLKPKEELQKTQIFSPCKNIIFIKSSKRNQNPSRYYNSCNESQVSTQTKISSFKNPHIKIRPIIT